MSYELKDAVKAAFPDAINAMRAAIRDASPETATLEDAVLESALTAALKIIDSRLLMAEGYV